MVSKFSNEIIWLKPTLFQIFDCQHWFSGKWIIIQAEKCQKYFLIHQWTFVKRTGIFYFLSYTDLVIQEHYPIATKCFLTKKASRWYKILPNNILRAKYQYNMFLKLSQPFKILKFTSRKMDRKWNKLMKKIFYKYGGKSFQSTKRKVCQTLKNLTLILFLDGRSFIQNLSSRYFLEWVSSYFFLANVS